MEDTKMAEEEMQEDEPTGLKEERIALEQKKDEEDKFKE